MEPYDHQHISKILVYQSEYMTINSSLGAVKVSFSAPGFKNQRCTETPHFMMTLRDICILQVTEGNYCLQYTTSYINLFNITSPIKIKFPLSGSRECIEEQTSTKDME